MTKTLTTNQASLILSLFTVALKLSALPALMFAYSGNDCYIACLIALVFDFLGSLIIIHIMHKHPDSTFFNILKETLGKVMAIIIQIILFIYFFLKCVIVLQELHDYFIATLFEELDPVLFIAILGLLLLYSTTKNLKTIGRVVQLIFWPTVIGIGFTLIFPINDMQLDKLFPIFEQGFYPIFKTISRTSFAFGDYMILLPLMGKISYGKKSKKQILLYLVNTLGFVFNFYVIFVGSFGKFSSSQTLALGELPLHNTTPATIGKLEWLTIVVWTVILLINAIIIANACRVSFDNIFNVSDKKIGSIVISSLLVIVLSISYLQLEKLLEFFSSPLFASIAGAIQVGFILLLVVAIIIKGKRNKKAKSSIQDRRSKVC